jgi:CBS domain-containing protein
LLIIAGLIREARHRMEIVRTMCGPFVFIARDGTATETAGDMERSGIGSVGVVDGGRLVPIVIDRDLVSRSLPTNMEVYSRVDSIMRMPSVIDASADLHHAHAKLRTNGPRWVGVEAIVGTS